MKIDNKGMTLVELLVTFSLLLIIVVGLYNLILEVKFEIDDRQIEKDIVEFSSFVNNDIHYNLLLDKPFVIFIKDKNSSDWVCTNTSNEKCELKNNSFPVEYKPKGQLLQGTSVTVYRLNSYCKDIYPCAVYYYYNKGIHPKVIALNKDNDTNSNTNLHVKGVLYGDTGNSSVFEPVPNNEFIEIRDMDLTVAGDEVTTIKANRPYIEVKDNVLIINYALYIIDNDTNYGFKIAYPFS